MQNQLRFLQHSLLLAALIVAIVPVKAAAAPTAAETVLTQALLLNRSGRSGRSPIHTDPVEAQIVAGQWTPPHAGDKVTLADGTSNTWTPAAAGKDGWFESPALAGGYAYLSVEAPAPRVAILEAAGHNMVYVNGEPRAGDPYGTGWAHLPILLRAGRNDLLFQGGRGRLRVALVEPHSPVVLDMVDNTLPDLVQGERQPVWAAALVLNCTTLPVRDLTISASCAGARSLVTPLPIIPPLTLRKVGFRIAPPRAIKGSDCPVGLMLEPQNGARSVMDRASLKLRVRRPSDTFKRTFISGIDGSVQYFAVNPRHPLPGDHSAPALFLSLHGAGVEAIGQADAYESKNWGTLVAPTNRRPYGFDWEDWGRLDAMEVLDHAIDEFHPDPQRIYLTGHSMGGHGTWQIGVTYPDRFAAIGASAGWVSFWSYAGVTRPENPDPVQQLLQRATSPSDTLALLPNTTHYGVYILHGSADDNVPVEQAKTMVDHLSQFHHDFVFHEQPGVGHWWDVSPEPGADCVDWAPMFDLFDRHTRPRPDSIRQVDFVTASPGVSARCDWLTVEAQIHSMQPSTVHLNCDPGLRRFEGTTENVARLSLDLDRLQPGAPLALQLDGQEIKAIPWPVGATQIWIARQGDKWSVIPPPGPELKSPLRSGPFKDAFKNRFLLVYGTTGTPEENAWSYSRARLDAETFWYRGNGSVDMLPDTSFQPTEDRDRSIILYGNADTNGAWHALLEGSPVQVSRGEVRIGGHDLKGDDLACLFIRPRPGSDRASVGVVSGAGLPGMRLTDRLPIFLSGVGYPDCTVLGADVLSKGSAGVRAAGFFGNDWGVDSGDFAWASDKTQ